MKATNQSFTKVEHEVIHAFREQINLAESLDGVGKVFSRTILDVLLRIFGEKVKMHIEDITLTPEQEPGYAINENLLCNEAFQDVWLHSDLPQIVERFASSAEHRFKNIKNLKKHEVGTGSKIGRH